MRNSLRFTILAVVLAFLVACSSSPSRTFTITGHYIEVESETEIDSSVEESTDISRSGFVYRYRCSYP